MNWGGNSEGGTVRGVGAGRGEAGGGVARVVDGNASRAGDVRGGASRGVSRPRTDGEDGIAVEAGEAAAEAVDVAVDGTVGGAVGGAVASIVTDLLTC